MTVGRRRHGVVFAALGCQGRPSTSPCCRRRRPARRRFYRRPPERRPRHCGGRDGGAGAMGPPPDEGGAGGSGTPCVRTGGRPHRVPVHDSATGDREGGEVATATRGGGGQGKVVGTPLLVGLQQRWMTMAIRRHQATINPMMATMAAVADDDGDGGRRRQ